MSEIVDPPSTAPDSLAPSHVDDQKARRNALLLSLAQAIYGSTAFVLITTSGLVGYALAPDPGWATLPVSTYVIGTACATFPASLFMRRVGRRIGFLTGAGFGFVGATLATAAIVADSFGLFLVATFISGGYQAFSQFYRFAAADTASAAFLPKAVSWVMVGGIAAAFVGPLVVVGTKEAIAGHLFAGCFMAIMALSLAAMAVLSFIDIPREREEGRDDPARPLPVLLRQPRLVVAIFCGMLSYAMMTLVMTAAPLAMVGGGIAVGTAAFAIQWHVLGMYVPSFFTGSLIARFGKEAIIAAGMGLLAGCGLVALSGEGLWHYLVALVLLGVGWNFGFIGATTMVTECARPGERAKVQGINDLLVFSTVAVASLSSGQILHLAGWTMVILALFPLAALTLALVVGAWMAGPRRKVLAKTQSGFHNPLDPF